MPKLRIESQWGDAAATSNIGGGGPDDAQDKSPSASDPQVKKRGRDGRPKSAFMASRIELLQKTLVFKTRAVDGDEDKTSPKAETSPPMSRIAQQPTTSRRLPRGDFLEQMLKSRLNSSRKDEEATPIEAQVRDVRRQTMVVGPRIKSLQQKPETTIRSSLGGRNIRREIAEDRFKGLADLFVGKAKQPKVLEAEDGEDQPEEEQDTEEPVQFEPAAQFGRPPGPRRASRRLPSRWATQDGLILSPPPELDLGLEQFEELDRKCSAEVVRKSKNEKKKEEEEREMSKPPNDRKSPAADSSAHYQQEAISALAGDLKQQRLIQRRISYLLRDVYATLEDKRGTGAYRKALARVQRDIIFANKCLLISEQKQKEIHAEIGAIRRHQRKYFDVEDSAGGGRGCLALKFVTLPLRRQSSSTFLIALIHCEHNVIESAVLTAAVRRTRDPNDPDDEPPRLLFELNELFEELTPDFGVTIEFYQLELPVTSGRGTEDSRRPGLFRTMFAAFKGVSMMDYVKHRLFGRPKTEEDADQLGRSAASVFLDRDPSSNKSGGSRRLLRSLVGSKAISRRKSGKARAVTTRGQFGADAAPLTMSSFKLIGVLSVNRSNWNSRRVALNPCDIAWSVVQGDGRGVQLEAELMIDYGPEPDCFADQQLLFHLESRTLTPDLGLDPKQLVFALKQVRFERVGLKVAKQWLKCRTKRDAFKYDLGQCLNPPDPDLPLQFVTVQQHKTLCLVFVGEKEVVNKQPEEVPNLDLMMMQAVVKPRGRQFHFIFIRSNGQQPEEDSLAIFAKHLLARAHSVRQWHSPPPPKSSDDDDDLLDDQQDDEDHEDGNVQAEADHADQLYRSVMRHFKLI